MISPTRLSYTGKFAFKRHLAEANSAKTKVTVNGLTSATYQTASYASR
jgi:hypothetical protein